MNAPVWTGEGQLWKNLSIYQDGEKFILDLSDSIIGYITNRTFVVPQGDGLELAIKTIKAYDLSAYNEAD